MVKTIYNAFKDELFIHGIIGKPLEEDIEGHAERILDSVCASFKNKSGIDISSWEIDKLVQNYNVAIAHRNDIRTDMEITRESLTHYFNHLERFIADIFYFDGSKSQMKMQLFNIINRYESKYTDQYCRSNHSNTDIGDGEMFVTTVCIGKGEDEKTNVAVGRNYILIDDECNLLMVRILEEVDEDRYLVLSGYTLNATEHNFKNEFKAFDMDVNGITLAKVHVDKMIRYMREDIECVEQKDMHVEIQVQLENDLNSVREEILDRCKLANELEKEDENNFIAELSILFSRYQNIEEDSLNRMYYALVDMNGKLTEVEEIHSKVLEALNVGRVQEIRDRLSGDTKVI